VTPMSRVWCIFEAHITQQLRHGLLLEKTEKRRYFLDVVAPVFQSKEGSGAVTMTMLQDAVWGCWNEIAEKGGVFFPLHVARIGVKVDIKQGAASYENDRRSILNYIAQGYASRDPPPNEHPKYEELNHFVHSVFASAELYRLALEQPKNCLEEVRALLHHHADVNSFVRNGNTPLFAAAGVDAAASLVDESKRCELIRELLRARADVNHANADMMTLMDYSAEVSRETCALLMQQGAKPFSEAAPTIEQDMNAKLSRLLRVGFSSEKQAFIGGDAGTKLSPAAQRSLESAAAAVLKLYRTAPCKICLQTSAGRHQVHLAEARAMSVRATLVSAGCHNAFYLESGTQDALLSLTIRVISRPTLGIPCRSSTSSLPSPHLSRAACSSAPSQSVGSKIFAQGLRNSTPLLAFHAGADKKAWAPSRQITSLRELDTGALPSEEATPNGRPPNVAQAVGIVAVGTQSGTASCPGLALGISPSGHRRSISDPSSSNSLLSPSLSRSSPKSGAAEPRRRRAPLALPGTGSGLERSYTEDRSPDLLPGGCHSSPSLGMRSLEQSGGGSHLELAHPGALPNASSAGIPSQTRPRRFTSSSTSDDAPPSSSPVALQEENQPPSHVPAWSSTSSRGSMLTSPTPARNGSRFSVFDLET